MATISFAVREIHTAKVDVNVSDGEASEFEHLTDNEKKERADELMTTGRAEFVDGFGEYVETVDNSAEDFEISFSE